MITRTRVTWMATAVLALSVVAPSMAQELIWRTTVVDPEGNAGGHAKLAILPSGQSAVAYMGDSQVRYCQYDGGQWVFGPPVPGGGGGEAWYDFSRLAIDPSGNPAVSFRETTDVYPSGRLMYAAWVDGQWTTPEYVDWGAYLTGEYNSLAMVPTGRYAVQTPAISYYQEYWGPPLLQGNLKYAEYDPDADEWVCGIVDGGQPHYYVGTHTSLAVLYDQPAIAYYEETGGNLKFAYRTMFGEWVSQRVDGEEPDVDVGQYASLAALPDPQRPAISYYDATNQCLKFAWFDMDQVSWRNTTVYSVGLHDVGRWTSLAITADGQPAISFFVDYQRGERYVQGLFYAVHLGAYEFDDENWYISGVDISSDEIGHYSSLAFQPLTGYPVIAYYDATNEDLRYAIGVIPGDLNADGCVDLSDLAVLLAHYGTTSGMTYEDGDIDGDGDVDLQDLAELLAHYGEGC